MMVCLIIGISGDDLFWNVVTPELFDTIRKEVNGTKGDKFPATHPRLYDYGENDEETLREGVIEQFFTQAWTTADTNYEIEEPVREILTYMVC